MSEEQRKTERHNYLGDITLEFLSGRRDARISDISEGGCYIDSIASVTEGETVQFDISSDSGKSLSFTGEVAYVLQGLGFGIQFTNLTEEQKAFLATVTR